MSKQIFLLILVFLGLFSLGACVGNPTPPTENPPVNDDSDLPDAPQIPEEEMDKRQELRVMSFNMQTAAETVGERAQPAIDYIAAFDADIVGAQEINYAWLKKLEELGFFETYAMVGEARQGDSQSPNNEYSCIFYKKDVFTLVHGGTLWLSHTPNRVSKFENSDYYRIMSYAFLERKSDGAYFLSVNTHLEWNHGEGEVNLDQTEMLLQLTDGLLQDDIPVIFTGDFNEPPTSSGYAEMLAWGYEDTRAVALQSSNACTFFDGYRGELTDPDSEGTILDYCFVSEGDFDVSTFKVGTDCESSDHFPVLVTMKFKEQTP